MINLATAKLHIHVFQLHDDGPASEELEDDDLSAANHWLLPATEFDGVWENLIFDSNVKSEVGFVIT